VACGKAHVGVQRGSEAPQQGDGGLGAALLDALDLVGSHFCAQGEIGDAQAEGDAPVIQGLAEGQGFTDRDPLRIVVLSLRAPSPHKASYCLRRSARMSYSRTAAPWLMNAILSLAASAASSLASLTGVRRQPSTLVFAARQYYSLFCTSALLADNAPDRRQ